jgi:hypothetical protein
MIVGIDRTQGMSEFVSVRFVEDLICRELMER